MLPKGVIEPSNTDSAAPIVLAPKPYGSLLFCVDYRRLNAMTVRDIYPIPQMNKTIDSPGEAVILSTLVCNLGYWKTPMAEKDKKRRLLYPTVEFTVL